MAIDTAEETNSGLSPSSIQLGGRGSVISLLLANVYLHYVFDLSAERWRPREATGDMIIVRYADDTVVGFQHEATPGASRMRCAKGSGSSRCRCIRTRPG
jgi:hypothetical protein